MAFQTADEAEDEIKVFLNQLGLLGEHKNAPTKPCVVSSSSSFDEEMVAKKSSQSHHPRHHTAAPEASNKSDLPATTIKEEDPKSALELLDLVVPDGACGEFEVIDAGKVPAENDSGPSVLEQLRSPVASSTPAKGKSGRPRGSGKKAPAKKDSVEKDSLDLDEMDAELIRQLEKRNAEEEANAVLSLSLNDVLPDPVKVRS